MRVARLVAAACLAVTGDLRYHRSDEWYQQDLDRKAFMRRAFAVLAQNAIEGDYAEFGCWSGRTFALAWGAARLMGHPAHLWAFDSFKGLPETTDARDVHPRFPAGAMAMTEDEFHASCAKRGIPPSAYTTIAGFYDDTLGAPCTGPRPDRISLAYIDCDLYTSTAQVLEFLAPRLRHGMILAFDDYYNYGPSMPSGERLAAAEFFHANGRWQLLPFIRYAAAGMSFVVEERAAGPFGWEVASGSAF